MYRIPTPPRVDQYDCILIGTVSEPLVPKCPIWSVKRYLKTILASHIIDPTAVALRRAVGMSRRVPPFEIPTDVSREHVTDVRGSGMESTSRVRPIAEKPWLGDGIREIDLPPTRWQWIDARG
jgi:hypothetical protein